MSRADAEPALHQIRAAYDRRAATYSLLENWVWLVRQEKERAIIRWLTDSRLGPVAELRLVELGCGTGANLLDFLRLGFDPGNLVGVDLIARRVDAAREMLPPKLALHCSDASSFPGQDGSFDVVYQSLMCSSILDDRLLDSVVRRMWSLARPGGGVLWYDFTVNNPRNPDVRGIPLERVRELFPHSERPRIRRLTLAPPIARRLARVSPRLYAMANAVPLLRTHVLCWFPKPSDAMRPAQDAAR
jgi:SAM-dependent methyltransferase